MRKNLVYDKYYSGGVMLDWVYVNTFVYTSNTSGSAVEIKYSSN